MLTDAERAFVLRQPVARLGTADAGRAPHVMPVCFALEGDRAFIAIDQKPKGGDPRRLKRLRNILENDRVCLTVDRYEADWRRLGWVMLRGRARVVERGVDDAIRLLRERYPQYRAMALEERPMIVIEIERVTSWGELSE